MKRWQRLRAGEELGVRIAVSYSGGVKQGATGGYKQAEWSGEQEQWGIGTDEGGEDEIR